MTRSDQALAAARTSGFTEEYQKDACTSQYGAYRFARDIPGADIEYCQKRACGVEPYWAYVFVLDVRGADVEYCKKHMDKYYLDIFLRFEMEECLK